MLASRVRERRAAARWMGTLLRGLPVLQVSEVIRTQNGPNPSLEMSASCMEERVRPGHKGSLRDGAQGPPDIQKAHSYKE